MPPILPGGVGGVVKAALGHKSDVVGWSLGTGTSVSLVDPVSLAPQCVRLDLDISRWKSLANKVVWPSGPAPGKAWVLLQKRDLSFLDVNTFQTLTIRFGATTVAFSNLVFSRPMVNVTPGVVGDLNATYFCELSDIRHILCNRWYARPMDAQYNVLAADTGTVGDYYADTKDGLESWTWQTMLDDIWERLAVPDELGGSPQLPFDPDDEPRNIKFVGVSAWVAYNEILKRLGCSFVLRPSGTTAIVQQGSADAAFTAALVRYGTNAYRLEHDEPVEIVMGKVPASVRVYFHKVWEHAGNEPTTDWAAGVQPSTNQVTSVDISGPEALAGKFAQNSMAGIWDDMPAMVDADGVVSNTPLLLVRAAERVTDYYRMVYSGGERTRWVFRGFLDDASLLPGSQVSVTCWSDQGWGARTEIFNNAIELRTEADVTRLAEARDYEAGDFLRGPDFARTTYTNYPVTDQIVRNVSAVASGGLYDGWLVRVNPETLAKEDMHRIWIHDPNA